MEKLQCSVCGGTLIMSDDGERAVCESCGMSFKKETVKKMIMELSGPVQVEGIQNSTSLVERAEVFLRIGELHSAEEVFRKLTYEYPADYRGWWGLTRLMDWEKYFYDSGTGEAAMPLVCLRAMEFAPEDVKDEIRAYFEERIYTVKSNTDERLQQEEAEARAKAAEKEAEARAKAAEKEAEARVKEAAKEVEYISDRIAYLSTQIKDENKIFVNNKRYGDRRPITVGNIIALALGCGLTYAAWFEFHPVGTPVVTLIGIGLPIFFLLRRLNRIKGHRDFAVELKREQKKAQQELPAAKKELEDARAALQVIRESKEVE